jgi:SNF2 family DNA or RNA helicase
MSASASLSTRKIPASLRNTRINVQPDSHIVSVPASAPAPLELGKYVQRFHDFLTHAGLQHKDYQTQGIQFCLRNEMRAGAGYGVAMDQTCVLGGIVADEMGLGKTIMMIGLTISNFKKRTLIVLPVALVKQWEQQILKTAGHHALVFYGTEKRKITPEMLAEAPIVITTYGHMIRRPNSHRLHPLYALKWDRVIFDEAHHVRGRNTQIFKSVETLNVKIRWFVTGTPIQNSIHDLYALCALLGLPAAYYANKDNLREIVKTYVLKRTKKSVGLSLPPLTTKTIVVKWDSQEEMVLSRNLHSGIGCLNVPALADQEQDQDQDHANISTPAWFPEPSPVKIGRMIQAKQSCIYPRLACRKSVPQMPPTEDENYSSKISKVVRTILSRKDNGKRKIVFCHFRGEIDYIQSRITTAFPSLVVRYLDGRTSESERRVILAPDAAINVLILQIQTCCEGLNLQQFSEVYFVSPDWNPAVEDQAIARCHRFGQTEPVSVFRFVMAPLRIRATPELVEQQQQQQQQQHAEQQLQDPQDAASQASTASQPDEDDETLDDATDGCIAIDTIEAYTANIQNKKRIFAEEVLNVV